ncbi:Flp family type IVb pilin [Massilia endophytica]|uniref:Flp family type IVb pilin n=1 Tax=Massilia endophytica TaxID=2899220 RepID=UPI001E35FE48|nr:Flp family type IVb pilin [Massilia endophytica]UGQ46184.1 Flp family type IVb pilin [Massilia endophytica]
MNALYSAVRQFVRDEEGITAIEYGLVAAVLAVAVTVAFDVLGDGLKDAFDVLVTKLTPAP